MDPGTTPLLYFVLGNLAHEVITGACKDYLKDKLKSLFSKAAKLGSKNDLELAYEGAMQQAFETCCEVFLRNIETFGAKRSELPHYRESLEAFIKDPDVAAELFRSIQDPNDESAPSPKALQDRWEALDGRKLPTDQLWPITCLAYRNQALQQSLLSDPLREILLGRNVDRLLKEVQQQGGVKVQVRLDKYSQRMRTKFSPVDLANLMPAYADDPGRMVIRDVFVGQNVRENPPPVEIPKDLAERFGKGERHEAGDDTHKDLDEQQIEKLGAVYIRQTPKPVLGVIAATGNRLLVLTGEPGSGKSTLMRYLLTGIIEPSVDRKSGEPMPWTLGFKDAFPLLIELRDFYALRRSGECDSFLEYVAYMGKTDQWFLDDHAVHGYLESGTSLVMFDGLDEIFDTAGRERVMQEIAGFAQRYPRARIIVTSRPVGYKEQVLRDAGFAHFGIQDLDDGHIETFIRGWFALTFSQHPRRREQRIERVLGSVRRSKPIRLLAGNPMLLTIMALLAREQELPRERAKFYEKAMEVFCHHWSANQGLDLPGVEWLNVDDKSELLRRIATRMQTGPGGLAGNVIHEDDLEDEIKKWFIDRFKLPEHEAIKAARTMIVQLRKRNYILCLRASRLYGFLHRTFLEYLTAAEYVHRFHVVKTLTETQLIDLFDQHCSDDDWREVLRLICAQIDEQFVGRIIEHLAMRTDLEKWDRTEPLREFPLAVYFATEVRNLASLAKPAGTLLERVIAVSTRSGPQFEVQSFLLDDLLPACRELGARWPGRERVERIALSHLDSFPRDSYGQEFWPHFVAHVTSNRELVMAIARTTKGLSNGYHFRLAACKALSDKWPDTDTRNFLEECALDKKYNARGHALQALGEKWPDETTRKLLAERAVQDEDGSPRSAAIQALGDNWPDESTRKLLTERAVQDENYEPRRAALQALADNWADKATRKLLAERAVQDEDGSPRSAAIQALADNWPDESTRKLLAERAVQDKALSPRIAALQALGDKWADESTRKLLAERARVDDVAASVFGGQHSEFGRRVFHAMNWRTPSDPVKPISREHIELAAIQSDVPLDKIDETVRSLSAHMGWDITKGSGK